jgi:periplasmic protein TonB
MSYADQRQGRAIAIGSVIVVHAGLAAVLLSGLAVERFIGHRDPPLETYAVPDQPPPPPDPVPPEPRTSEVQPRQPVPVELPTLPEPTVPTPGERDVLTGTSLPADPGPIAVDPPRPAEPAPPVLNLSRAAAARGNQGDWFPQDSYPAAARRAGAAGRVSVAVTVGTDGRVSACEVTATSGNDDLDAATCRLARRNARFTPALDAEGRPTVARVPLKGVRWELRD